MTRRLKYFDHVKHKSRLKLIVKKRGGGLGSWKKRPKLINVEVNKGRHFGLEGAWSRETATNLSLFDGLWEWSAAWWRLSWIVFIMFAIKAATTCSLTSAYPHARCLTLLIPTCSGQYTDHSWHSLIPKNVRFELLALRTENQALWLLWWHECLLDTRKSQW